MLKYNLISDLSNLTCVKPNLLTKFTDISNFCICDYLAELNLSDDDTLVIDIGIGTLSILVSESEIKYQFKPALKLEKAVVKTILDDSNPLLNTVENNLENRLLYTYKELI